LSLNRGWQYFEKLLEQPAEKSRQRSSIYWFNAGVALHLYFSAWIIQSCRDWSLAICPYMDDLLELRYSCFCNGVVRVMESGDHQGACFIKCSMPHTRYMHASPLESLSQGLRIVLLSILLCTSIDLPECFVSRGCDGWLILSLDYGLRLIADRIAVSS
jgi:hypothetical protein